MFVFNDKRTKHKVGQLQGSGSGWDAVGHHQRRLDLDPAELRLNKSSELCVKRDEEDFFRDIYPVRGYGGGGDSVISVLSQ